MSKIKRVRCSSLYLAKKCKRFPWLSVHHPASHDVTRFGSEVDAQVSKILTCLVSDDTAGLPSDEELLVESSKILEWLEISYPLEEWEWLVHERVELEDPETGELLTKGTTDLICLHRTEPRFVVIDWKKRGQVWAGHLQKPDVNDQQLAYLTAFWLKISQTRVIESAQIVLACWDEKGVFPLTSKLITEERLTEIIDGIRAIPPVDPDSPKPEASVGEHCNHCYQRGHCDEHLLPLAVVLKAGLPEPFAEFTGGPLSEETTIRALAWMESAGRVLTEAARIKKLVEGNVDAYVLQHGAVLVGDMMYGPQEIKGKRGGATVKTLEKEGLTRLIREGEPKVKCKWYQVTTGKDG